MIDYERDPPQFDWRNLLAKADGIIARVAAERLVPGSAARTGGTARPSRDLSVWRRDIAELLAEVHEVYLADLDRFEARTSPSKPKRWLADPKSTNVEGAEADKYDGLTLDDCISGGLEKYWVDTYGLRRGNPGMSHTGGPPPGPLHNTYRLVHYWWAQRLGEAFAPTFPYTEESEVPVGEEGYPDAVRFFLAIIQGLNPGYTAVNARALYETMGKPSSMRNRKRGI